MDYWISLPVLWSLACVVSGVVLWSRRPPHLSMADSFFLLLWSACIVIMAMIGWIVYLVVAVLSRLV